MSSPPTPPSRASHAASLPAGGEEEASALRVASRIRRRTNSTRRAQNKRSEESSPASTAWCAARHVRVRLHARASPAAVCTAPQNNAARRAKGRGARKKRTKEAAAPSAAESSHRLPSAPTAADAVAQSAPLQPITARGGSLRHAARAATARVSPGRRPSIHVQFAIHFARRAARRRAPSATAPGAALPNCSERPSAACRAAP